MQGKSFFLFYLEFNIYKHFVLKSTLWEKIRIWNEVKILYHRIKSQNVSNVKQREDKYSRFDYSKVNVNFTSGIIGGEENMKDSRWLHGKYKGKGYRSTL